MRVSFEFRLQIVATVNGAHAKEGEYCLQFISCPKSYSDGVLPGMVSSDCANRSIMPTTLLDGVCEIRFLTSPTLTFR